jgi:hypothetical protein
MGEGRRDKGGWRREEGEGKREKHVVEGQKRLVAGEEGDTYLDGIGGVVEVVYWVTLGWIVWVEGK